MRVVWVYETRGCGVVTPEHYRELLALRERQVGYPLDSDHIPWDLEIVGGFPIEVTIEDYDEMAGRDETRWDYCGCGGRGANAVLGTDGELRLICQRCEDNPDPWGQEL